MITVAAFGCLMAEPAETDSIVRVRDKIIMPWKPGDAKIIRTEGDEVERVIVGHDTVDMVLPVYNYGRYDRHLSNYLYIPKGSWSFGLTASYGSLSSNDMSLLNMIGEFDFDGRAFSIRPYGSYFFRSNQCIGLRFNYSNWHADLKSLKIDFIDDLNLDIHNVLYDTKGYSMSVFYRNYIGLDRHKRFGIFNEVDLSIGGGNGKFVRYYSDLPRDTRTSTFDLRLNFSPGVSVFFHENVAFNVSFGVFGIYYTHGSQTTYHTDEEGTITEEKGSRNASGANFKFNLFNINFGIAVHI